MAVEQSDTPSWNISGGSGIRGPIQGSAYYCAGPEAWQATESKGFWIKPLFEDASRGEKTLLMKIDPGAYVTSHTHEGELEQLWVLEGSFYDQDRTLNVGDYCCRAPNAAHTAGSAHGAIVLVIYTRR
jgi:anti-sigma factor ChrR (cupin superfamily)